MNASLHVCPSCTSRGASFFDLASAIHEVAILTCGSTMDLFVLVSTLESRKQCDDAQMQNGKTGVAS